MPKWLQNQMKRAFLEKDRYQIKLLNQCWFFYTKNTTRKQCFLFYSLVGI
ncbi:cortex morphogenetic protein CmpA [Bacillus spongiae]|uniref:Cortex morphogenetic protein CmpA n=1 Tax=Bacillus spongiae TaxID=2683610 RepID=A0ABU8HJU3_9BACI